MKKKGTINLARLADEAMDISIARKKWCGTSGYLKDCAGEVTEAAQALQAWIDAGEGEGRKEYKKMFALELADVIMCALLAAKNEKIDIVKALKECHKKNKEKAGDALYFL